MSKYVKNADTVERTWCGMQIQPEDYYLIQGTEEAKWANTSAVLESIVDGTLVVSKSNDSSGHIADFSSAVNYLKGDILDIDTQGRQVQRIAAGQAGWVYFAHPVEIETAKVGSLYEKTSANANRSSCSTKFYDANDAEVTAAENEATIVKTVLLFKPSYDYELISGSIQQIVSPSTDVRVWVMGGIIELGGAYVKEFGGGLNMIYFGANEAVKTDGRAAKYMKKDIVGVPYQANQLQMIIKHTAGHQHKLMFILEYFRA